MHKQILDIKIFDPKLIKELKRLSSQQDWSVDYLVYQLLMNRLHYASDYDTGDLDLLISSGIPLE